MDSNPKVVSMYDWLQAQASLEAKKPSPYKEACDWGNHVWIDVGFRHSKWVCKHCDIEKPKEIE